MLRTSQPNRLSIQYLNYSFPRRMIAIAIAIMDENGKGDKDEALETDLGPLRI